MNMVKRDGYTKAMMENFTGQKEYRHIVFGIMQLLIIR